MNNDNKNKNNHTNNTNMSNNIILSNNSLFYKKYKKIIQNYLRFIIKTNKNNHNNKVHNNKSE